MSFIASGAVREAARKDAREPQAGCLRSFIQMKIALELIIFLGCILIGARLGGIALGTIGHWPGDFRLSACRPRRVPAILGMLIAVITALATMQAASADVHSV